MPDFTQCPLDSTGTTCSSGTPDEVTPGRNIRSVCPLVTSLGPLFLTS